MATTIIVVKLGVYRHDITGPFTHQHKAEKRAEELLLAEKDHYHSYEVVQLVDGVEKILSEVTWNHRTDSIQWQGPRKVNEENDAS